MSLGPKLVSRIRSHPILVLLAVGALALAAIPLTNAMHLGSTGTDIRVDAAQWTTIEDLDGTPVGSANVVVWPPDAWIQIQTAYELQIVNIPVGNGADVEIRAPNGTILAPATPLTVGTDGPGTCAGGQSPGCLRNATFFISAGTATTGTFVFTDLYDVWQQGGSRVATVFVGPRHDIPLTVSPAQSTHTTDPVVFQASTGISGIALDGSYVPSNATTDASGNFVWTASLPEPGVYSIRATKEIGNNPGGADLPERIGFATYETCAGPCAPPPPTPTPMPTTPTPCNGCPPPPPPTPAPVTFRLKDARAGLLAPVLAPIVVDPVYDLGSATLTLRYDPNVVEVTSVSLGDIEGANLTYHVDASAGTVTMLHTRAERPAYSGNTTFAVLGLRAVGPIGSNSSLVLSVVEATDSDGYDLPAVGSISTFRAGILGDADSDGDVDVEDLTAVSEVVVGNRPSSSIAASGADVSLDGVVSGRDAMMLRQYLAGTRAMLG